MLVPRQLLYGDSLSTTCLHTNAEVFGLTTYSHRLIPRIDNMHNYYETAEQRKKEMTSFCAVLTCGFVYASANYEVDEPLSSVFTIMQPSMFLPVIEILASFLVCAVR